MKTLIIGLTVLGVAYSAQAALVVNGDVSTAAWGETGQNHILSSNSVNVGWVAKTNFGWDITDTPGQISFSPTSINNNDFGIGQVNAVTTETGTQLKFAFDWTSIAGATGSGLSIDYQIVGWKGVDDLAIADTDRWFTGINFISTQVRSPGGSTKVDLLTNTDLGGGNDNASIGTFTGTAGSMVSEDLTLNLSEDVSNFDYIGIKFSINSAADASAETLSAWGSTLDNVSLTVIPEPATLGMIAAVGTGILFIRRRFMI